MKNTLIVILFVIMAIACQDEQVATEKKTSDIVIKSGEICGWCSKNDTLSIIDNKVTYVNYKQCSNTVPAINKTEELNAAELEALLSALNFNEFKKIKLNTCNVCADGCDHWISIKYYNDMHYIRFTGNEPELIPIKDFIDRLNTIQSRYQ